MTKRPGTVDEIDADHARRLFLRAQGLSGPRERDPAAVLRRLGFVQLDTISVLARSHELVPYSRIGPVARSRIEAAYWSRPPVAFETGGLAVVLPIEEWPYLSARRRRARAWTHPRRKPDRDAMDAVRALIRERGPITSEDLGGARAKTPASKNIWWHWSPLKIAAERLLWLGEVACVERRGWRRVYDLAEDVIPKRLRRDVDDETCFRHWLTKAGERLGVGTLRDLQAYFGGMSLAEARATLPDTGLVPVTVRGWDAPAWADPKALASAPRGSERTTLLSPFDTVLRNRDRVQRLFGVEMRLESYTPAAKRVHGYFAMPLLARGRIRGRVDPGREGTSLVAKRVSVDRDAVEDMAGALVEAASWVGCDAVRIEEVRPASLRAALRRAVVAAERSRGRGTVAARGGARPPTRA